LTSTSTVAACSPIGMSIYPTLTTGDLPSDNTEIQLWKYCHAIGVIFKPCGNEKYLGEEVNLSNQIRQRAKIVKQSLKIETLNVAALLYEIGYFTSKCDTFMVEDSNDRKQRLAQVNFIRTALSNCIDLLSSWDCSTSRCLFETVIAFARMRSCFLLSCNLNQSHAKASLPPNSQCE